MIQVAFGSLPHLSSLHQDAASVASDGYRQLGREILLGNGSNLCCFRVSKHLMATSFGSYCSVKSEYG